MFFMVESALIFVFFFFFQAEDGIRDIGVTGVQTCALPIFIRQRYAFLRRTAEREFWRRRAEFLEQHGRSGYEAFLADLGATRSEERRVGKECRSRWWREH